MDGRVLRPIATGCTLISAATLAPAVVARLGGDLYLGIGTSLVLVAVSILVVRSQVLGIIGARPSSQHAEGWPLDAGAPREVKSLGGPSVVLLAHALFGWSLASLAVAVSADAIRILAAEILVVVMLLVTLTYERLSRKNPGEPRESRVEAGRDQLLLISWGLFGYLALLVSLGGDVPRSLVAVFSLAFYGVFVVFAGIFLRWRKNLRSSLA